MVNDTAEHALMERIRAHWGAPISAACSASSVPPEFLAALIANESGGDNEKPPRFEPSVYRHLVDVQAGNREQVTGNSLSHRPAHFGPLFYQDLRGLSDQELRNLASSWGLTQIMGYHLLKAVYMMTGPQDLLDPSKNLREALHLLAAFGQEFQLDLRLEFEEMFRCWNTGQPDGKTFDPEYVANGLRRLAIYAASVKAEG